MSGPVLALPALLAALEQARTQHPAPCVVLTNGIFDLLHLGHLRALRQARAQGDLLVVGVNADASVAAQKPGRPIVPAAERAELVGALEPVSYVVVFEEPTADALIRAIRPAVYAKGADYTAESLPERQTVAEVGARMALLPLMPDHSTTRLLDRLRNTG